MSLPVISKGEFDRELLNPDKRGHNIIFTGMSGAGKTHWSKILAVAGNYEHVEFDQMIGTSAELAKLIGGYPGKDEAEKMGNYFGKPWEPEFAEKEERFLGIEKEFMGAKYGPGVILDMTGSCIYHPEEMLSVVQSGLVVYLETSPEEQEAMFQAYLADPKPVCWNGVFEVQGGEGNEAALERCYPLLLEARATEYQRWADVTLPHEVHKGAQNIFALVDQIKQQLR